MAKGRTKSSLAEGLEVVYTPSKVAFFVWTYLKGSLPTIDVLQHYGLIMSNVYPLCLKDEETTAHILIHCAFASKVWNLFLGEIGLSWVPPQDMESFFPFLGGHRKVFRK